MKIRSRLLTKVIVLFGVTLVRLLFKTCRLRAVVEADGVNPYESTGERRYLYCVWHDQILMTVFGGRPKKMAGLVSGHQDGSYLAEAMKVVGIAAVRGSSKRGEAAPCASFCSASANSMWRSRPTVPVVRVTK